MEFLIQPFLSNPLAIQILAAVGALRIIIKPVISAIRFYGTETGGPETGGVADRIEKSKALKTLTYVLDWLTSIKLRKA